VRLIIYCNTNDSRQKFDFNISVSSFKTIFITNSLRHDKNDLYFAKFNKFIL
jgi:hypothetical protein